MIFTKAIISQFLLITFFGVRFVDAFESGRVQLISEKDVQPTIFFLFNVSWNMFILSFSIFIFLK